MIQTELRDHNPRGVVESTRYIKKINPKLTCIDLFAGAGGFSAGLSLSGFNVIAAVENDKGACQTLRANRDKFYPNMKIVEEDIQNITGKILMNLTGIKEKELDLLIGGPPCQGFSFSNTKRSLDDPRSKLMFEFIRMTRELQPKIFYVENVPGLLSYKDFFYGLMESFEKCGYVVRFLMLNAVNYGVPQKRRRIFIQGVRKDLGFLPTFPEMTNFSPDNLKSGSSPSRATIALKCFAVNGFPKEQIKEVWWNTKLEIMMNKKTAVEQVNNALTAWIFDAIKTTHNR